MTDVVAYLCKHETAYYGRPRTKLKFHPPTDPGWSLTPLVDATAVKAERERIFTELRKLHEQANGRHNYYLYAIHAISNP